MAPRTAQRDYAGVIADSPVRHALFNKPFTSLRRRTENLLDNITGGTTTEEILEAERREKERLRALTCRLCRVIFASEGQLSKHYDLFPAHLSEERVRSKPRTASQTSSKLESPSMQAKPPMSLADRQALMQHHRVRSSPNLYHTRDAIPSSRPLPTTTSPPLPLTTQQGEHAPLQRAPASPPHPVSSRSKHIAPSPPQLHARKPVPPEAVHRSASDFYPQSGDDGFASLYDTSYTSSPYALPNAMVMAASTRPMPNHHSVPLSQWQQQPSAPPQAAAMLPNFDFESRFQSVTLNGVLPPTSSQARPVTHSNDTYELAAAGRNHAAGARSAVQKAPMYTGSASAATAVAAEGEHNVGDPMHQRPLRRGATDSQLVVTATNTGSHMPAMPTTFGGVVRAVVATAATGPKGQPVMPSHSSPSRESTQNAAWMPLAGDAEDDDQDAEASKAKPTPSAFLKHTRALSSSSSSRQWGSLLDGLPGSPQDAKRPPINEMAPVGSTSFSESVVAESTSAVEASNGGSEVVGRARRNTNPFLNRDFMRGLPNVLKTPPLTPTSPWGGRGSVSSPGANPFKSLSDGDDEEDNDENVAYFDAPNADPKAPMDEVRQSRGNSMALPGTFDLASSVTW